MNPKKQSREKMNSLREQFLFEVLSRVRFTYDRKAIRRELEDHLEDHIDACQEEGLSAEDAEHRAVAAMGDADTLGAELNREHSPVIGWIWRVSRIAFVFCMILSIIGVLLPAAVFIGNSVLPRLEHSPKEEIMFQVEVDEKVQIDDVVIRITDVIYTKDNRLTIYYQTFTKPFGLGSWNTGLAGTVSDDRGNTYISGSSSISSGIISRGYRSLSGFPLDAAKVIVDYDEYNRTYHFEIALPGAAKEGEEK